MQGYIINFNRAKDEDLIVTVLTKNNILTLYRFYGARHSHINLGYKIDFESKSSIKSNIPQLRDVLHLANKWNTEHDRMFIWQAFIKLIFLHLKDVDDIHDFYFNLLDNCSEKWHTQNPKRVAIEAYIKLLEYEGRLHDEFICFNCEMSIEENPALIRGFLPAHEKCVWSETFERLQIEELFQTKNSLFINDKDIARLWKIMMEGL
ncbi:recombination protein RecO [Sulfurospirillum arcachonense]|uniref:recombination protein RecO n=1 Tax=Sulfurospirillum arcachonense TaxID=57666 RepID=UPI0004688E70|nr:recombination protein RecO [Sulfurospirillum arcachonense]